MFLINFLLLLYSTCQCHFHHGWSCHPFLSFLGFIMGEAFVFAFDPNCKKRSLEIIICDKYAWPNILSSIDILRETLKLWNFVGSHLYCLSADKSQHRGCSDAWGCWDVQEWQRNVRGYCYGMDPEVCLAWRDSKVLSNFED